MIVGVVHQASANGRSDILRVLLKAGFDVNLRDYSGETALHCAAAFGHNDVVEILLQQKGVMLDVRDDKRRTPLHCAAGNGNLEIIRLLLQHEVESTAKDESHRNALHFAATRGHYEVIDELLRHNQALDVDARDVNNVTPLHLAAGYGSVKSVELLLERKADADVSDNNERAVLTYAIDGLQHADKAGKRGRYEDVISLLLPKTGLEVCKRVACPKAVKGVCNHDSLRQIVCRFVACKSG
ncbi:uncharacterized protein CCOS01_12061 [Colletotrichum costaricense]|uniref:Ankyrin repeat protein n=1 Tax=Colletotrichum costaricense TaxID=1209916 RepID=A0AAI9YNU2_9PEZI|nr:uncharacterized protein CCOS01_12061 [Colletotrichum costaricense]KAK1517804.1 hypothetical protein CCOS01_12061 [Colletotrichum costaricense]